MLSLLTTHLCTDNNNSNNDTNNNKQEETLGDYRYIYDLDCGNLMNP